MKEFKFYNRELLLQYSPQRYRLDNEIPEKAEDVSTVYSQHVDAVENWEELKKSNAKYAIIGIPEDIGIRANKGRPGAHEGWDAFLNSFMNFQQHRNNNAEDCILLGYVHVNDLMLRAKDLDPFIHKDRKMLSDYVAEIDHRVTAVISRIIEAGKVPIVIGGGHNNCFPIIKAFKKIDVLNIDAHTDLRPAIGRHSGNGFSHAMEDDSLGNYYIYGLQSNYVSSPMWEILDNNDSVDYLLHQDLNHQELKKEVEQIFEHLNANNFGLEIDMDVVADFPSSAQSPVGISFDHLRSLLFELRKQNTEPKYIHICEAAPAYSYSGHAGKALATLINDLN